MQIVAANVVHPVTPTFFSSLQLPDYMFGAAFASMSLASFLFCPFWGTMSDRYGRINVLAFTNVAYGLMQFAFMESTTVWQVLLARFAGGFFSGGVTVCMLAYVADISEPRLCSRNMSWYAALFSASMAMGYFVGGLAGDVSTKTAFLLQVTMLVTSGVLQGLLLKDGPGYARKEVDFKTAVNPFSPFMGQKALGAAPLVFLVIVFISCFAGTAYDNAFNYYIKDQFAFPPSYNGYIYAAIGVIGLVVNLTINAWLQQNTNCRVSIVGIFGGCCFMLLLAISMKNIVPFIAINILFYTFNSMYLPMQQALVFQTRDSSNGTISGVFLSMRAIGMITGSLGAGLMYTAKPLLPLYVAGGAFAICIGLSVLNAKQYKKQNYMH